MPTWPFAWQKPFLYMLGSSKKTEGVGWFRLHLQKVNVFFFSKFNLTKKNFQNCICSDLTWHLKKVPWKRKNIYKPSISVGFHISFRCNHDEYMSKLGIMRYGWRADPCHSTMWSSGQGCFQGGWALDVSFSWLGVMVGPPSALHQAGCFGGYP